MEENIKIERQMQLEEEMRGLGQARYLKHMTAAEEATLPPGQLMLRNTVRPLSDAIREWAEELRKGNPRRFASILRHIEKVGFDESAFLTMRHAVNAISGRMKATLFALQLGKDLEEELNYRDFKKADPSGFKRVSEMVQQSGSAKYRTTVLTMMQKRAGISGQNWSKEEKLKLGTKLMELAIESTGIIELVTVIEGKNNSTHYIMGTDKAREWVTKQHTYCQVMSPLFLPMLCQPNDWISPTAGGYFTVTNQLVKTPNRNYLEELHHVDMPVVYKAVNAMQGTKWRINKRIYSVMKELWELGGDRAGLPNKDPKPIPNKPLDIDTNEESLKDWKRKAKHIHNYNNRNLSKVVSVAQKLWVAEKYLEEEEFYYVWTLDWRGRAYPVGTFVHPQSDDSGKALLEFAEGKPLGEYGVKWLAIQLANTWGNDKVAFADRVQWAEDNTPDLLAYAMDPVSNTGWMQADSPFCFLAACFEWLGFTMSGESHICNLPIQADGSCNGLQNFSAMLRDPVGGKATNLVPADKPQDIYGMVAVESNKIIEKDFLRGVPEAAVFVGKVDRKLTKRNTMTLPYAVTKYGMKDQLVEEFRKMADAGNPIDFQGLPDYQCAIYLAGVNYEAIGKVVVAARQAMDWLKEVATIAASDGLPVVWTNPAGMPIQQAYMETSGKRIVVTVGGKRTNFFLKVDGKHLNGRKQAAGISPNLIHSMDSGHMAQTINKCVNYGITDYSFIHDSFGTHACDMDDLSYALREAFVEQYSEDLLGKFRDEIVEQLERSGAHELVAKIPPIPEMGDLDLEAVKDSEYFFA